MSSKRRLRRRACGGKVRHADEAAALTAIRTMRGARIRESLPMGWLQAYRCAWCSGWHVGHPPRRA